MTEYWRPEAKLNRLRTNIAFNSERIYFQFRWNQPDPGSWMQLDVSLGELLGAVRTVKQTQSFADEYEAHYATYPSDRSGSRSGPRPETTSTSGFTTRSG